MNENEELRQRLGLDALEAKEVRGFVELLLIQRVGGELSCHLVGCQICYSLGSVILPTNLHIYLVPVSTLVYLVDISTLFSYLHCLRVCQ